MDKYSRLLVKINAITTKPSSLSEPILIFSCVWLTEATDNAIVSFVKYKGDFYVSTETNFMRRIDPVSLETKEKVNMIVSQIQKSNEVTLLNWPFISMWFCFSKVDWSKYIAVNAATAHPHYDRDGATYNLGNSYNQNGGMPHFAFFKQL